MALTSIQSINQSFTCIYLPALHLDCNMRKGTFEYLHKLSSLISLRGLRRLIRDDEMRFCAKVDLLKTEILHKKRKASFQILLREMRRLI